MTYAPCSRSAGASRAIRSFAVLPISVGADGVGIQMQDVFTGNTQKSHRGQVIISQIVVLLDVPFWPRSLSGRKLGECATIADALRRARAQVTRDI